MRPVAVREAGVSGYHSQPFVEPLGPSQHYRIGGFRGAFNLASLRPRERETGESLSLADWRETLVSQTTNVIFPVWKTWWLGFGKKNSGRNKGHLKPSPPLLPALKQYGTEGIKGAPHWGPNYSDMRESLGQAMKRYIHAVWVYFHGPWRGNGCWNAPNCTHNNSATETTLLKRVIGILVNWDISTAYIDHISSSYSSKNARWNV